MATMQKADGGLTAAGRAVERLVQLAQDIGWQHSDDRVRYVAQAGILYLSITVIPSKGLAVHAEDTLLNNTVRAYYSLMPIPSEKRSIAEACIEYMRSFHGPLASPKERGTHPLPRPSDPDQFEDMYIGEQRVLLYANRRALNKWARKFYAKTVLLPQKWRLERHGNSLQITRTA